MEDPRESSKIMNASKKIVDANNALNGFKNKHKKEFFKEASNVIMIILAFGVLGLFDFGSMEWDFSQFTQSGYYIHLVVRAFALVIARKVGVDSFLDKDIASNVDLKEQQAIYSTKIKYKDRDFGEWVTTVYNRNLKKDEYLRLQNIKLLKMEKKASEYDKYIYFSKDAKDIEESKENKYCEKRRILELSLKEDYIEAHIDSMQVKYYPILATAFTTDVTGTTLISKRRIKVVGDPKGVQKKQSLVGIGKMIIYAALISGFATSFILGDLSTLSAIIGFLVQVFLDIFFICRQFYHGMISADGIVHTEYIDVFASRNEVLTEYMEWESPKEHSAIYESNRIIMEQIADDKLKEEASNIVKQNEIDNQV